MSKLTFIKSYTIRERYSEIYGFDQTIAIFETGIGGKKRLVKHLDRRWPDEEYKINDYPLYTDDEFVFDYICLNHARQVAGKDISTNKNTITNFTRWVPLGTDKKPTDKSPLSNIKYLTPRTEIDKKFAKFVDGFYPPYYEILKTGGASSIRENTLGKETVYEAVRENINHRRRFSTDKYFFNNGAEIDIQWVEYNATLVYAGDRYSNNWGDEMDPRDLGLKDVVAPTNYKKTVRIGLPDKERKEGEPYWFTLADKLTISTYSLFVAGETFIDIERKKEELGFSFLKSDDFSSYEFKEEKGKIVEVAPPRKVQKEWEGIKTDDDILKEILRKWQQKYKNSRLQIATNSWGYYALEASTPTVEWLLPTDDFNLGTGSSGPNGPNGPSGPSGPSASITEPITGSVSELKKGTFIFDVTRKDIMFNAEFGDLTVIEKEDVDPFIFDENQTDLLDSEYIEAGFEGQEDQFIVNEDAALQMMLDRDSEGSDGGGSNGTGTNQSTTNNKSTEEKLNKNDFINNTGPGIKLEGGASMKGKVNTDFKKSGGGYGVLKKNMSDKQLLQAMVGYIEGGYYYPAHAYEVFNERSRKLYGASGETLWGIDRHAGQTEKSEVGKKFWTEVDKLSGYGDSTGKNGYAKDTNTKSWNSAKYKLKKGSWGYNYSPPPGSSGYDVMYNAFVNLAVSNLNKFLDSNFGNHPVKKLILSDTRFKFLYFRATWNGPGWFQWYASGKGKIKGLKWAYDNETKNVDELIIWDLNNRLKFENSLITHDVSKMATLLGLK
jgi:hypothetical protein